MFCQTAALQGHTDQVQQQKAKERNCRNSNVLKQLWQTLIHQFEFCIVIAAAKRLFCSLKRSDRFWQVFFSLFFSPPEKQQTGRTLSFFFPCTSLPQPTARLTFACNRFSHRSTNQKGHPAPRVLVRRTRPLSSVSGEQAVFLSLQVQEC